MALLEEDYSSLGVDVATQTLIAPVLLQMVADRAFAIGDQFIYQSTLYKITTAVVFGTALVVGTNCDVSDTIAQQLKDISHGGHEMNPTPSSSLTEGDVVSAVNGVLTSANSGLNDQVASVFSIGKWTNTMTKKYFVQGIAGSSTPISKTGIGNWCVDGSDETGWITIPELVGIGSLDHSINITYDPSKSGIIIRGGYVIDDTTGKMCIKFANEISEADTHTAKIGIEITINRTESNPVSWS